METIESFACDDPLRHSGIGGSEAGTVLDVNPYMSAVELYYLKRGEARAEKSNHAADLGHVLENWILDRYEEKEGIKLERPGDQVFRHSKLNFIFAHIDGNHPPKLLGVDAKSTGIINYRAIKGYGQEGTDQVPEHIIAQCVHYMSVMDYERWDVAALLSGRGVKFYPINRDLELEEYLLEKLQYFWFENVKAGRPPKARSVKDIEIIYRFGNLDPKTIDPEHYEIYKELLHIKQQLAKLKADKEECEFRLKEYMGDHNALVNFGGDPLITWKCDDDSKEFNKAAFKQDHQELYDKYLEDKPGSRRFLTKSLPN